MNSGMSTGEFLADIRGVISSPKRRFALISERRVAWGSLLLLLVPAYFGLSFAGGIYFDGDPFPGYSFLAPLAMGVLLILPKPFFIHLASLFFLKRGKRAATGGSFWDLLIVFGYTNVPVIIAMLLALFLFLFVPEEIGYFYRNFRTLVISFLVAVGLALFIWNLILMVLALRSVYDLRDGKIVLALVIGSLLAGVPASGTLAVVATARISLAEIQPLLGTRILRLLVADPHSPVSADTKLNVHVDRLAYRVRFPDRFDVVTFTRNGGSSSEPDGGEGSWAKFRSIFAYDRDGQAMGRIVGIPGDRVDLVHGELSVNGTAYEEPYLSEEHQADRSLSASLGPGEYLILPEDRRLIDPDNPESIVRRLRITGRVIMNRYPLGWLFMRPGAFAPPHPKP